MCTVMAETAAPSICTSKSVERQATRRVGKEIRKEMMEKAAGFGRTECRDKTVCIVHVARL